MIEHYTYPDMKKELKEFYPWFSEKEYQRRYKLVRDAMAKNNLSCLIIYRDAAQRDAGQADIRWLSNWADFYRTYLIFPLEGDPTLFFPIYGHMVDVMTVSVVKDCRWMGEDPGAKLAERIKDLKLDEEPIGIDNTTVMPVDHYESLREKLPKAQLVKMNDLIGPLRMLLSPEELEWIEKGVELTDLAFDEFLSQVKPGVKEYELAAAAANGGRRHYGSPGIELVGSFPMSNPFCPNPWWFPSARPIQKGDLILTEISANYWGYQGQICRTIAMGEPTPDYRRMYDVAVEVYRRLQNAMRPGNTEQDLIKAGEPIMEAGFTIMPPILHGWSMFLDWDKVGLPFGASPGYRMVKPLVMEENMTLMIEPCPCTIDLRKAVFIGDLHIVTPDGGRCLHRHPLEFIIC